eukprot:scaffold1225_cov164-Amphora_coffeaeformis.AAC.21
MAGVKAYFGPSRTSKAGSKISQTKSSDSLPPPGFPEIDVGELLPWYNIDLETPTIGSPGCAKTVPSLVTRGHSGNAIKSVADSVQRCDDTWYRRRIQFHGGAN